ncbi:MAG: DUF58 domain-containing protein [Candidatus Obscuribacterales bacterium]|nr:DUF58 domain-containing protein [Candidatus Obscuribacterales bacterium]
MSASVLASVILSCILPLLILTVISVHQTAGNKATAGQNLVVTIHLGLHSAIARRMPVQWLRVKYLFPGGKLINKPLFIESLLNNANIPWVIRDLKRGVFNLGTVEIETSFPLGFVWFKRLVTPASIQTITVYPRVVPIEGFFLYRLPHSAAGAAGSSRSNRSTRASTFTRGIREYVRGDSPRHVHWRSSAKLGQLMVREYETEGLPIFDVAIDLQAPWQSEEQFELAVTACASLLTLGMQLGTSPQLTILPERAYEELNLPALPAGLSTQMEVLARITSMKPATRSQGRHPFERTAFDSERTLVLVSPSGFEEQPRNNLYLIEVGSITTENGPHKPDLSTTISTTVLHRASRSLIFNADDLSNL